MRSINLLEVLQAEISRDIWDFGTIRALFLGLRLTENEEAIKVLVRGISDFVPFVKELVLFLDLMHKKGKLDTVELSFFLMNELEDGASLSVPTVRVWLLELFVRGCVELRVPRSVKLKLMRTLCNRQLFLIRGIKNDLNFFRRNKTRFEQKNVFEKYYFLLGASCLPADEYRTWVGAVRGNMTRPLDRLFCNWVQTKQGKLAELIQQRTVLTRD